jgi:hypothetical protein
VPNAIAVGTILIGVRGQSNAVMFYLKFEIMKSRYFATLVFAATLFTATLLFGCSNKDNQQSASEQGTSIDSNVVGKDTASFDTREDIKQSDEEKLVTPGRDTIKSDEPRQ